MNTISCIVVDDEPLAVRLMESYVAKTPFLSLKGSFTSGTAAYSFLQDNPVDLLFCDIQMPNLSGMDLSRMLPERTRIIFTTAFSEYAVEGFKVRALDYLLKPISYDDFLSATVKAKEYFEVTEPVEVTGQRKIKSIFVKTEYRLQQIDLDRITYIEGLKDYALHAFLSETPIRRLSTKPFPAPSSFLAAKDEGRGTQLIEYECKKQCRGVAGCTTKPFFFN